MKIITLLLSVLMIAVFAAGCTTAPKNEPFIHREWLLISYNGTARHELTAKPARIDLSQKSEGKLQKGVAELGCSRIQFTYKPDGDGNFRIRSFEEFPSSCENNDREKAMIRTLSQSRKFMLTGHYILLTDADGNTLKCIAADWD